MQDLWDGAVGEAPTAGAKAVAVKVHHDLDDQNIEAFLSKVESFLQVSQDEVVSGFLKSSKQVILDKCSAFLDLVTLEAHKTFLHRLSRRRVRDQRLKVFTTIRPLLRAGRRRAGRCGIRRILLHLSPSIRPSLLRLRHRSPAPGWRQYRELPGGRVHALQTAWFGELGAQVRRHDL